MKKVDRNILKNFLNENGCQDTNKKMQMIEPFYQIAESEFYPLATREEIDEDELKCAITLATDKTVEKIIFISPNNPFPKPKWMTKEVYKNCLRNSIKDNLVISLRHYIFKKFGDAFNGNIDDPYWKSLSDGLFKGLYTELINHFWFSLNYNLYDIIIYYLFFSTANDDKKASLIEPLMTFWQKCWILGEKKDEPKTWLIREK